MNFAEGIRQLLDALGYDVRVEARECFPIAGPLSAQLSSAAAHHDIVIVILADSAGRNRWVELEMAYQAHTEGVMCRFVVIGGTLATEGRLAVLQREDTEGLLAHTRLEAVP